MSSNDSNDTDKQHTRLDPTGVDDAYIPPEQPETKHHRFKISKDTLRNHFIAAAGEFCGHIHVFMVRLRYLQCR